MSDIEIVLSNVRAMKQWADMMVPLIEAIRKLEAMPQHAEFVKLQAVMFRGFGGDAASCAAMLYEIGKYYESLAEAADSLS